MAKSITLNNLKHIYIKVTWFDIAGCSTLENDFEFNNLKCAKIVSECYLYDIFQEDGIEYVRTFASYQNDGEIGYGDRNVYPMSVFTKSSQKRIRMAWKDMARG